MSTTIEKQKIQYLEKICRKGMKSDDSQLTKNMATQFSDPNEWIREYLVNAFDANASSCTISGTETDDEVTIIIYLLRGH